MENERDTTLLNISSPQCDESVSLTLCAVYEDSKTCLGEGMLMLWIRYVVTLLMPSLLKSDYGWAG